MTLKIKFVTIYLKTTLITDFSNVYTPKFNLLNNNLKIFHKRIYSFILENFKQYIKIIWFKLF